tara:strand:- start:3246 stop:3443 length:198 start_codon:yes stop_codon:yes gene_type:complete
MSERKQYEPTYEGTTHVSTEREEFRVGAKGFLYRRKNGEWTKTTFDRYKLLTVQEFRLEELRKRK